MAQQDNEIVPATAADIAAAMSYHRKTYRVFLKLLTWAAVGSAALLVVVFFLLRSMPVERVVGGNPPPGIVEAPRVETPGGA